MSGTKALWIILLLLILSIIVWGLIGGSKADDVGIDCDFGLGEGETICWKWSKNAVGEIQDNLSGLGKAIEENLQKLS